MREDYAGSPYDEEVFSTTGGRVYSWYDEPGFGLDMEAGHGTHTAGSAAGSTLATPAETVTCETGSEVSCIGKCLTTAEATEAASDNLLTWDTLCPQFDCDGGAGSSCLSDDVAETLTDNGGIARGAKISVFDVSIDGTAVWASLAENGLWDATEGTGCMLHSNSWGGDADCNIDSETVAFDQYMYEVSRCCWRTQNRTVAAAANTTPYFIKPRARRAFQSVYFVKVLDPESCVISLFHFFNRKLVQY